jgi:hypothetical protein
MFKQKFKRAIEKILTAEDKTALVYGRRRLTRVVKSSTESNTSQQIQEVLSEFDKLPETIEKRFTRGSLYEEGHSVFGWYSESQVQAEELPVEIHYTPHKYIRVSGTGFGFFEAMPLPLLEDNIVCVPPRETFTYAECGWANACPLHWHRDEEGYKVNRSIIPHGFWQAWKWWEGAQYWYLERRPELFEDFDCWGKPPQRLSVQPKSGDVVLGGANANKEFWESQKFYLE